jgi:hypothetical protein
MMSNVQVTSIVMFVAFQACTFLIMCLLKILNIRA